MNILYKYCDYPGAVRILEDLELKLPYIDDVNDPFDSSPYFFCDNDFDRFKKRALLALERKELPVPADFEEKLRGQIADGSLKKSYLDETRKSWKEWNQKSALLSVTKNYQNILMWSHYASENKGLVIGFDFSRILGIAELHVHPVYYSHERPRIDVLIDADEEGFSQQFELVPRIKSLDWGYEREYRAVLSPEWLKFFELNGMGINKNYRGKNTRFLKIHPASIKTIIYGLQTEDGSKAAIDRILSASHFNDVAVWRVVETDSFDLKVEELLRTKIIPSVYRTKSGSE